MDKNAIKRYAVWARKELIDRVTKKAQQFGITKDEIIPASADSIKGHLLTKTEKAQRTALIEQINKNGYKQVIEGVAYTWFNRFSALRFMEVNGYLPTHIRVFTDEENNFKPQILAEAIHLELDGLQMDKVYELKQENKTEELFKYLIITQCNALGAILPGMFQKIEDYTELLFPDNLLREGSVIQQMIEIIPEEDWTEQVQIIGWLYQFYNIEPKAEVFSKKTGKISKEEIPAATQLFTPDWIVRYMVENSLGRMWVEGHPNDELKSSWKYYIDEAEQEPTVKAQLEAVRGKYANIKPEEIKVIDPCMGSGHILAYMFDVLIQIYEAYGYSTRDAVKSIVENNLYGLDIDDRAAQLAGFSVMMKARQYDKRFFSRKDAFGKPDVPQPRVYSIMESNGISQYEVQYFINNNKEIEHALVTIINEMHDAKEYGSILNLSKIDFDILYQRIDEIIDDVSLHQRYVLEVIVPLIKVAEVLSQNYQVVVTNPPYMSVSAAEGKLYDYVLKNYPCSKTDLFSVFIEKCRDMLIPDGIQAMITMHSWMFLSSFERLRERLLTQDTINMIHLGSRAFEEISGEIVQTTAFVLRRSSVNGYFSTYCRLVEPTTQQGKEELFLTGNNRYISKQENFSNIPGSPIAYWAPKKFIDVFKNHPMDEYVHAVKGLDTCDNDRFVRAWSEVEIDHIGFDITTTENTDNYRWYPYCKGGGYSKWYGFWEKVVEWQHDGVVLRNLRDDKGKIKSRPQNTKYYFMEGMTFSTITSNQLSMRYMNRSIFGGGGSGIFSNDPKNNEYFMAFLNSNVANYILKMFNPTMNFLVGDMLSLPVVPLKEQFETVSQQAKMCIDISKDDWDSFETSWNFKGHPLVLLVSQKAYHEKKYGDVNIAISDIFDIWAKLCENRFKKLKETEENLNQLFIEIYGLQDELTPYVEDKNVSVVTADLARDIRSFISYAVGCMFGRYSLDHEGLVFAGGTWDANKYIAFRADKDNVLPICDDDYFEDDIVGKFIRFVEVVYGTATLEQNLKFIADALGGKGTPRDVIRNYFLNEFYNDHLKTYQKRPIYWQFDSGKKNGFKCLVYMHRYQPDTIARIRTDYVHEQQARYRTAIADVEMRITNASTAERVKLNKQLLKLKDQDAEIHAFEEKIHHLADQMIRIDLDDGVKHNYEIFKDVLTKLK